MYPTYRKLWQEQSLPFNSIRVYNKQPYEFDLIHVAWQEVGVVPDNVVFVAMHYHHHRVSPDELSVVTC
jgi:hypothetical protein